MQRLLNIFTFINEKQFTRTKQLLVSLFPYKTTYKRIKNHLTYPFKNKHKYFIHLEE